MTVSVPDVHTTLARTMLADGLPLVFDPVRSSGPRFHDAVSGRDYLDFFGFFGSLPLGYNHSGLTDPEWVAELGRCAIHKPSNSDIYTVAMADFVKAFTDEAMTDGMQHLFFVSGGALAVENALKAAFDWKTRLNRTRGRTAAGHGVIHLEQAFHGRSGYTLSLTNTDPVKTEMFPKFDWPRVPNPFVRFPLEGENLADTEQREGRSLAAVRRVLEADPHTVAAILVEPIQCEGGDHHFRREFFQGLRALADEFQVLLVYDEVQTGFGSTGRMWCWEHFDVAPDLLAFGKKTQVCGIMAGPRMDEVPENVFRTPSRINSTWGGNLVDMVRCRRILQIYAREHIIDNAHARGEALRAGLEQLVAAHPAKLENARGRGLIAALDVRDGKRDAFIHAAFDEGLLCLSCGSDSVRFRPALDLPEETVREALEVLDRVARKV